MILVTGATGALGSATIDELLKHRSPSEVAGLVRQHSKAQALIARGVTVRIGSYEDTVALERALENVEKVMLVSAPDPNGRIHQHRNVLQAAKKAGIRHFVYTGFANGDVKRSAIRPFLEDLIDFEDEIRASGLPYTILRNSLYADGIPFFAGPNVLESGIRLPAGNGRVAFALRAEMGEAAARVMLSDAHYGKTYTLTGSQLYAYQDVSAILSRLTGKLITYVATDPDAFSADPGRPDLPELLRYIVGGFAADIAAGLYETVTGDLATLLGREPASLDEALLLLYGNLPQIIAENGQ